MRFKGDNSLGPAPTGLLASTAGFPQSASSSSVSAKIIESTAPTASVRVQKDFMSTVLFETVITQGGKAQMNFTAPDSLSTFVVRTYAASGDSCLFLCSSRYCSRFFIETSYVLQDLDSLEVFRKRSLFEGVFP